MNIPTVATDVTATINTKIYTTAESALRLAMDIASPGKIELFMRALRSRLSLQESPIDRSRHFSDHLAVVESPLS